MDNVRILKGYSKAERKELEEAKDSGFSSVMTLIYGIGEGYDDCHALYEKYCRENTNDNNQMAKDIIDFYCGNAKFPEQKYYIQLIKNNDSSYLNRNRLDASLTLDDCRLAQYYQTKFTEQEIKAIDPRYMAFAVLVEDDDK
ncbi:DUF1642 domain-containing protein [Companilactobacillus futsaii]|uniref:DUF1642 domain-containing protein n=2 Tax=Companilactobacillus futsaii TaxID=938155 RepID=A0A5B7SY94_9LACO|nr:DUF1642 domain-containing protein [Companilactobacillus futsaii]KRK90908.1 hypothetical protein FC88_GL001600 [Companilactobacillus futsaii JCM 17355]QCX24363.1 DUF1642 domain-containing protein [Companilactobacillus futsaii]